MRLAIRRCALVTMLLCSPAIAAAQSSSTDSDESMIRATIAQYFKGHALRDSAEMRKAFLPTAHIEGVREGRFSSWTLNEYVGNTQGPPAADEATRRRTVDAVSIVGTAAAAKATLVHGPTTFTDYFVLLKVDGVWRIANKVYSAAPTRTP
jgi:hypothetical protein